jgi:hypothetical protein
MILLQQFKLHIHQARICTYLQQTIEMMIVQNFGLEVEAREKQLGKGIYIILFSMAAKIAEYILRTLKEESEIKEAVMKAIQSGVKKNSQVEIFLAGAVLTSLVCILFKANRDTNHS